MWSGEEVLVCCGRVESGLAGAAAYDPASDTWRRIADPPVDAVEFLTAVWTGRQMLVTGGVLQGGSRASHETVAYDPATDRWSLLAPAPTVIERQGQAVWTGARFDPDDSRWRAMADDPLPRFDWFEGTPGSQVAVWTGREMLVWAGALSGSHATTTTVLGYDPTRDRWRFLPRAPLTAYQPEMVTTGDALLVGTDPLLAIDPGYLGRPRAQVR